MKTTDGKVIVNDRLLRLEWAKDDENKIVFADGKTLYVSRLPDDTTKQQLEERFGKYGKVIRVWIAFLEKPHAKVCLYVCTRLAMLWQHKDARLVSFP